MASRISLSVAVVVATVSLWGGQRAMAVDSFYKGPNGPNWNVVGNWQAVYQGGTISTAVPRGSGGFNMRAVIGTDNTTYGLDKSVELNVLLPVNNQTIHGLAPCRDRRRWQHQGGGGGPRLSDHAGRLA
jgi:hypothetical protein